MYFLTKRLFDIAASFLGLLAISPLLAAISVLIKLDSKGPVFYKGVRSGKDDRPFEMFKF
ncbi:MAG: sugar transferase, partial [Thermodesulfobacteriota bacterium]|nr:sugar transferase [Thermodesulfobacteriota bacterium]